jgi:hypothetical protein
MTATQTLQNHALQGDLPFREGRTAQISLTEEQYAGLKNLAEANSNATIRFNISVDPDSFDGELKNQIENMAFSEKLTSIIVPNNPNQKSKLDIDQLVNKVIVFLAGGASLGAAIAQLPGAIVGLGLAGLYSLYYFKDAKSLPDHN